VKYISLPDVDGNTGRDIIEAVLRHPGERGCSFDQMLKRRRVWDALDASADPYGLLLEDADAAVLVELIRSFPFGTATRDLARFCSGVIEAKAPNAPMEQSKPNGVADAVTH
jgi:hypothetical protein